MQLLQCTASLPGGSGQCKFCNALPHCLGAAGSAIDATLSSLPGGSGQRTSCNALPLSLGAVGNGTLTMHYHTAWGLWAVELMPHCLGAEAVQTLQRTATVPGRSGQCNSCNLLPHCLRAAGGGTPAMQCLTTWGQPAVQLVQCTASLCGGSGPSNSCHALPHCTGVAGSATPARLPSLPGGIGQCNSCNALPHCLGVPGSGTAAMHCHTA